MDPKTLDFQPQDCFSDSYRQARDRFCTVAESLDAELHRYPIAADPELTIDVAVLPAEEAGAGKLIVISSGVHGVEGPFGSAVQLAWLEQVRSAARPSGVGFVLIHAVNPFGFAHHRRWNEDNVDLNRNFFDDATEYRGAPRGYVDLHALLNPPSPPSRWEPFRLKAIWHILRLGLPAIKEAVATGQYEYPQGIFFGGRGPSASANLLREHFTSWVGDATEILHLDFHTGLGRFAEYRLLLESDRYSERTAWFKTAFGQHAVEPMTSGGTAYQARGTLGGWATRQMADRDYHFATVEFGTYGTIRILAALRAENRAFHLRKTAANSRGQSASYANAFVPPVPRGGVECSRGDWKSSKTALTRLLTDR